MNFRIVYAVLIAFILFCNPGIYAQPLNGTYTVGGNSPDYTSIALAVSDLNTKGVSGPVKFKIRQGLYNGRLATGSISGASLTNTIEFVADQANTLPVIIRDSSTSSSTNYIWKMTSTRYITLDSLILEARGLNYARVIELVGYNKYVTVSNCQLIGRYTSNSNSTDLAVVYAKYFSIKKGDHFVFDNNDITNGSYGFYLDADGDQQHEFKNNRITQFYSYGFWLKRVKNSTFTNNTLSGNGEANGVTAFYLNFSNGHTLSSNRIVLQGGSIGISLISSTSNHLYNNSISITTKNELQANTGIFANNCTSNKFNYNSVFLKGGMGTSSCISAVGVISSTVITNNLLVNLGTGYALRTTGTKGAGTSNYNNLYTAGPYLAFHSGKSKTLAEYQSASGREANSQNMNPNFRSATDLTPKNIGLIGLGTPVIGITKDIDGKTRSSTIPTIGAFEFTPLGRDIELSDVRTNSTVCTGSQSITATLVNLGADTLKSAQINWSVSENSGNSVAQSPLSWTGSLSHGDTAVVTLGNYTFANNKSYTFNFYSSLPNALVDEDTSNDTLINSGLKTSLSGTFTVGGSNPDFLTLDLALATLDTYGICGPVILNIRQGTYTGQKVIPYIEGSSLQNTLTIRAEPTHSAPVIFSHTVSSSSKNYVIQCLDCEHVILDSLHIQSSGTNYARALSITGDVNYLTVKNCVLSGIKLPSSSFVENHAVIHVFTSNGMNYRYTDAIKLQNNKITYGNCGIYLQGEYSDNLEANYEVSGNDISDFKLKGIFSADVFRLELFNNEIRNESTATSPIGLDLEYNDLMQVYGNKILLSATQAPIGLKMRDNDGDASGYTQVYNNLISLHNPQATGAQLGIHFDETDKSLLVHNTVNLIGGNSNSAAFYSDLSGSDSTFVYNNLWTHLGDGYAIYLKTAAGKFDYNNLYTNGSYIGYLNGAKSSLSSFQSILIETNSLTINPELSGPLEFQPQRFGKLALNDKGTPLTSITTDYAGNIRSTTKPDQGAYEYSLLSNDVGVSRLVLPDDKLTCGSNNQTVSVLLTNFGSSAVTSIPTEVKVSGSGTATIQKTYSGSLASGKSDTLEVGSFNSLTGGNYTFTAYTKLSTDPDVKNDTLVISNKKIYGAPGTPTVTVPPACLGSDIVLTASGGKKEYRWYDQVQAGTLLSSKNTLDHNQITQNDTFYVETFSDFETHIGKKDNSGTFRKTTAYNIPFLRFHAHQDFYLDSFTVHPEKSGTLTIQLTTDSGTTSLTKTVSVFASNGAPYTVYMGWFIPAEKAYKIRVNIGTTSGLYYNSTGTSFPYNDTLGIATFYSSYPAGYWPFFYNWKVRVDGCRSARKQVIVDTVSVPVVDLGNDTNYCTGSSFTQALDAKNPNASYLWSSGSTASKDTAKTPGIYWCEVTNQGGCSSRDSLEIGSYALPIVNFPNPSNVCAQVAGKSLSGATPSGGTYSGTHINQGIFDPINAGPGSHVLYYSFTDTNTCTNQDSATIVVDTVPVVTIGTQPSFCSNDSAVALGGGIPVGGNYTGLAVSQGKFLPTLAAIGSNSITYRFTDSQGCWDAIHTTIQVDTAPVVQFTGVPNPCAWSSPMVLNQGLPAGGTYKGNRVNGNLYQAGPALKDSIEYVFVDGKGCRDSVVQHIEVLPLPQVTLDTVLPQCANGQAFILTGGHPSGGTYFGQAVSNGNYHPLNAMAGRDSLFYSWTDSNQCVGYDTVWVKIKALPQVTLDPLGYACNNDSLRLLTEGMPIGGVYSGTGISGSDFDPASAGAGQHLIYYAFTNSENCTDSAQSILEVEAAPVFSIIGDSTGCGEEHAPVLKASLTGMDYLWSDGSTADSLRVNSSGTYQLKLTDPTTQNLCFHLDSFSVVYDINCLGVASLRKDAAIHYFPNPSRGYINLELSNWTDLESTLVIVNTSGQEILRKVIQPTAGIYKGVLDLSTVEGGVYFLRLISGNSEINRRILIQP